jgi:hypothetical protein
VPRTGGVLACAHDRPSALAMTARAAYWLSTSSGIWLTARPGERQKVRRGRDQPGVGFPRLLRLDTEHGDPSAVGGVHVALEMVNLEVVRLLDLPWAG